MTTLLDWSGNVYFYPGVFGVPMAASGRATEDTEESSDSSGIRIKTENENWRGKNDPAERRRIQNRLNQRAFRQRRRTGLSPPQSVAIPRSSGSREAGSASTSGSALSRTSVSPATSPPKHVQGPTGANITRPMATAAAAAAAAVSSSSSSSSTAAITTTNQSGKSSAATSQRRASLIWDELARTINGNLMEAVSSNARTLGLDETAVHKGDLAKTPDMRHSVPRALTPDALQYRVAHDLIYDTIPHARLRQNIMAAIVSGRLNQAELSNCIRASGSLEWWDGSNAGIGTGTNESTGTGAGAGAWHRRGLVVWGDASSVQSWELTEGFVRKFGYLLHGCHDFLVTTNNWRMMRGESPIAL